MKSLIKKKEMKTKKDSIERVFIEDKKLSLTDFEIGKRYVYEIDYSQKKIYIKTSENTDSSKRKVKVSSKTITKDNATDSIPVLDIRHPDIKKLFSGIKSCVVEVYKDEIIVSPKSENANCKDTITGAISNGVAKVIDLLGFSKTKAPSFVIQRSLIGDYLKAASGGDNHQISMFDLGFTLSEDLNTQHNYAEINSSETLRKDFSDAMLTSNLLRGLDYFELFAGSGIGGKALDNHGADNVGYSEIDKFAIKNYDANFPGRVNYGDISTINCNDLPDFDILIGGSPCQDICILKKIWNEDKKVEGLKGDKSSLFFEFVRVLNDKKPRWFIFENVQNLLHSNNGEDFKAVKELLGDKYNLQWEVINTSEQGVPQTRRRLYILGQLKELGDFTFKFPSKIPLKLTLQDLLVKDVDEKYFLTAKMKQFVLTEGTKGFKQKAETDLPIARPLLQSMHKCHRAGTDNYVTVPVGYPADKSNLRKLLPIECARLQGILDDTYKFVVSDTQAYRLMGNAMSLNVVSRVAHKLGLYIRKTFGLNLSTPAMSL